MKPSPVILPNDLILESLSFLPVKSLLRFRCVSNSWNTFISDPSFVKLHFKRSSTQNPLFSLFKHLTIFIPEESPYGSDEYYSYFPYSASWLLENPSFTLSDHPYYDLHNKWFSDIVGSCNGLICLAGYYSSEYWFYVWNPATRTSKKCGCFRESASTSIFFFAFGCDNSTGTYKVVAYRYFKSDSGVLTSEVRVLSLGGDDIWRNIESFPIVPYHVNYEDSDGYLNGTLNWLANHNAECYIYPCTDPDPVEQFVIVSLDLGTETYHQYLLPSGFEEVPPRQPYIVMLGGCLCFSYCHKEAGFVIWEMKKFGDEDSWTQLFQISYQNLQIDYNEYIKHRLRLHILLLSKDSDTLLIRSTEASKAFLYNRRDKRVEPTNITPGRTSYGDTTGLNWDYIKEYVETRDWDFIKDYVDTSVGWDYIKDYVESLVPLP